MTYRALVVDDNPEILEVVGEVLCSLGHEFDTATCQDEARRLLGEHQYSYHLLDLEIPVRPNRGFPRIQNGENLLREIATRRNGRAEPILVMTGHGTDSPKLAVQMMKLGADDYITKPFATVGRTLDRAILEALETDGHRPRRSHVAASPTTDADVPLEPFTGGELTFFHSHVDLLGVTIISDRGTGQCMAILNQLRRKSDRGQYVRMSGEELATAIQAAGGVGTITGCVQTLRRNIINRLRKTGIAVGRDDVIQHDQQGYCLHDSITVHDGDTAEFPSHVPADVPANHPHVPAQVPAGTELNPRQRWIVVQLGQGVRIQRAMVEREFGVGEKTAKRDLSHLVHLGMIEYRRMGREGAYRLVRETGDLRAE